MVTKDIRQLLEFSNAPSDLTIADAIQFAPPPKMARLS